jgi:integrase
VPDLLSRSEIERMLNATRELRYQVFILAPFSMGLRIGETLNLTVSDVDSERMRVHVRQGKGNKDRLAPLPTWTLRKFGQRDSQLQATLAATAVLHTHSRRLDYHPHLHLLVPGGGIHVRRREWRTLKGSYLFNHFNLATVFRAILLRKLHAADLRIPANPQNWVAHCECVGSGRQAIEYLSRYLYRGLLSNKQIINDSGTHVTFTYRESNTNTQLTRTLKGEDLIRLLLIHVLPKGFRRARDYGFLHGNAKRLLATLQIILKVAFPETRQRAKAKLSCPCCHTPARILAFIKPHQLAHLKPG